MDKALLLAGMPMKVGVMGGATGEFTKEQLDKAHRLGEAIAKRGCVLITGGCPGLPHAAACGAKQGGGFVIGISPGLSLDEHVQKYGSPTEFHDVLIFTGSGLMGREVVNIRSSDIVVIIGGRSGTLGELAIAYDEGLRLQPRPNSLRAAAARTYSPCSKAAPSRICLAACCQKADDRRAIQLRSTAEGRFQPKRRYPSAGSTRIFACASGFASARKASGTPAMPTSPVISGAKENWPCALSTALKEFPSGSASREKPVILVKSVTPPTRDSVRAWFAVAPRTGRPCAMSNVAVHTPPSTPWR